MINTFMMIIHQPGTPGTSSKFISNYQDVRIKFQVIILFTELKLLAGNVKTSLVKSLDFVNVCLDRLFAALL